MPRTPVRRSRRRSGSHLAATLAAFGALAVSVAAPSAPAHAQGGYTAEVIMSGLNNPRGLAFGAGGALYVAEAGSGGNGPSIAGGEGPVSFGATGGVTRYLGGVQNRVVNNLPSLASQAGANPGGGATGLHDIVFDSTGTAYGVIGLGANPSARGELDAAGAPGGSFGQLVRLDLAGGTSTAVADITAFEAANDPDGAGPDSNPYGLVALPGGGFAVADAGANALLRVDGSTVSLLTTFPTTPNPLPFGPPAYQSVPTAVALGPDGNLFVSELTGFPFLPGSSDIYRVAPDGTLLGTVPNGGQGFTNVVDLMFGPDGGLYVLQLTTNGLAGATGPGPGRLLRVDPTTGAQTILLDNPLFLPGGMTFGSDGAIYVSNLGTAPGGGQVLRVAAAVPEPGTLSLLPLGALALAGAGAVTRRRRKGAAAAA